MKSGFGWRASELVHNSYTWMWAVETTPASSSSLLSREQPGTAGFAPVVVSLSVVPE